MKVSFLAFAFTYEGSITITTVYTYNVALCIYFFGDSFIL